MYNNESHKPKTSSRGGPRPDLDPNPEAGRRHDRENSGGLRDGIAQEIQATGLYRPTSSSWAQEWRKLCAGGECNVGGRPNKDPTRAPEPLRRRPTANVRHNKEMKDGLVRYEYASCQWSESLCHCSLDCTVPNCQAHS